MPNSGGGRPRVLGLASGLALAIRLTGSALSPGSRVGACAHRLGDATGGSALNVGGADLANAWRSGPASCDLSSSVRDILARDDRPGQLAEPRFTARYGGVRAGL